MNNNTITRSAIHLYAHALRQNRATIIDEYTHLLETELGRMFPALKEKSEDGVQDWACDILNCDSKQEVDATLDRINDILTQQAKNGWVCTFCGKNTYGVDTDYLFGTNHINCALEEDIKNRTHSDPDYVVDPRRKKICELEKKLTELQNTLSEIKADYFDVCGHHEPYHHEPTN